MTVRHSRPLRLFKADRIRRRQFKCDACRWSPPKLMLGHSLKSLHSLMQVHHVIPLSCGGEDAGPNMILLCPNCHAIAHRLGARERTGGWPEHRWTGVATAHELIIQLRTITGEMCTDRIAVRNTAPRNYFNHS